MSKTFIVLLSESAVVVNASSKDEAVKLVEAYLLQNDLTDTICHTYDFADDEALLIYHNEDMEFIGLNKKEVDE